MKHFFKWSLLLFLATPALAQYHTEWSATKMNDTCFQLTADAAWKKGAVWSDSLIDLSKDQQFDFKLNFGSKVDPLGADGFGFVFTDSITHADTVTGKALGFGKLSATGGIQPSFAVEFDAFQNIIPNNIPYFDLHDPALTHIAFQKNGNLDHQNVAECLTAAPGWVQMHPTKANLQDNQFYRVRITWVAASNVMRVFVEDTLTPRMSTTYDIKNQIFGGKSMVRWGITAATGGSFNPQSVCFFKKYTTPIDTNTHHTTDTALVNYILPTGFAPNSTNSITQYYYPLLKENYTVSGFRVFDRWGELIYDNASTPGWDGTFKGEPMPSGAYVVAAEFVGPNSFKKKITQSITLIR